MGVVYAIDNLVTGGCYIGSSERGLAHRWHQHRKQLRAGTHHSRHLHRSWDKHGEAAFRPRGIEEAAGVALLEREQWHLDQRRLNFLPELNYNVCWIAGSSRGRVPTQEALENMSRAHRGKKLSPEHVASQVAAWQERHGRERALIAPDGVLHVFRNIRAFCRQHGLGSAGVGLVLRGKYKSHRGWTRPDSQRESLRSPDGVVFAGILNLKAFCTERGLSYKTIHQVVRGRKLSWRGWTCPAPQAAYRKSRSLQNAVVCAPGARQK